MLFVISLMQKMIIVNPQKRASLNEVVTHPWLQEVIIIIIILLVN